uniref:PB1 domain-containing protein n=1 Tax=Daphnia galeata TaxID=27404 RepID=A0A8J2WGN7_9CRUS|nr:unnamed protein product [Daphnia galeata]
MSSNNEMTLMLKCGLLVGDQQVGDFKFISWFYGQQKPYIRQQSKGVITQTLKERLATIFPDIVEPFQVVFIDEDGDKIILPVDDIKETVTALRCFGYLSSMSPIQIFVQIPADSTKNASKLEEQSAKMRGCEDSGLIIADKLSLLESTINILGQRIVHLLEDLAIDSKQSAEKYAKSVESVNRAPLDAIGPQASVEPTDSVLNNTQSNEMKDSPRANSRSSSSSSFSVQSHSDNSGEREDGWTRVNGEMNVGGGTRRRRFITESSCASHRSDHSQDGVMRSMEDEINDFIGSPDTMCRNP